MRGWLEFDLNEIATLSLSLSVSVSVSVSVKYGDGQFDTSGMNTQIGFAPPGYVPTFVAADPAFNDRLDDEMSYGGTPVPGNFGGQDAFDNTDTRNFVARLDYQIGDYAK